MACAVFGRCRAHQALVAAAVAQLPSGNVSGGPQGLPDGIAEVVRAKAALQDLLETTRADHAREQTRLEQALAAARAEAATAAAEHARIEAEQRQQLAAAATAHADQSRYVCFLFHHRARPCG